MKKTKKLLIAILIPLSMLLLHGCYPFENISISDSNIVFTNFNDSVNFSALKTYYMPDTVFQIVDANTTPQPNPFQSLILSTIESNMAAYGYTRLKESIPGQDAPDVAMVVSAMRVTTTTVTIIFPPNPWWGWGWWGSTYPFFPAIPVVSSFSSGTILMDLFDPADFDIVNGDTIVRSYWDGAINGVLSSSTSNMQQRIVQTINQAFIQTPQIRAGN